MSTNSAIGVVVNGKIKSVYCHRDGYVDGVGKTLVENYDQAKTEQLVSLGAISSLGSEIGRQHPFDTYNLSYEVKAQYRNMTTFYHRDRDEDLSVDWHDTAEDFLESYGGEYLYLLGTDGVWYYSEGDMNWKRVDQNLGRNA
jgi:hypothetical protein